MSSIENPPLGKPGFDLHADQRGRIIGSCVAIIVLTITFVILRLLSRRLSRAGLWVRTLVCNANSGVFMAKCYLLVGRLPDRRCIGTLFIKFFNGMQQTNELRFSLMYAP